MDQEEMAGELWETWMWGRSPALVVEEVLQRGLELSENTLG